MGSEQAARENPEAWRFTIAAWLLIAIMFPVLYPVHLVRRARYRWHLRRLLAGGPAAALERAKGIWAKARCVYGGMVGANLESPTEHDLAVAFAARYPGAYELVRPELLDRNPYVAAYAFKALIRLREVRPDDLPKGALDRKETIDTLLFGCHGERKPLGTFFADYFAQRRPADSRAA